jgi:hypothetical protein
MRNTAKHLLIIALGIFGTVPQLYAQTPTCDSTLWNHVYHSYRLVAHTECMTVTGYVNDIYGEADGDYHIRLKLDTQFNYMLNSVNISSEYGCLVCEPICASSPITQSDAVQPCSGLTNTVYLPANGEYVAITGSYVTDNDHGWNEIHPVTRITLPHASGIASETNPLPELKIFPQPASTAVNFAFENAPHVVTYISFYTISGKPVGDFMMAETSDLVLNTTYFASGVYLYTISQGKGILKSGEFVVAQ